MFLKAEYGNRKTIGETKKPMKEAHAVRVVCLAGCKTYPSLVPGISLFPDPD
jgi:hypothetical protein